MRTRFWTSRHARSIRRKLAAIVVLIAAAMVLVASQRSRPPLAVEQATAAARPTSVRTARAAPRGSSRTIEGRVTDEAGAPLVGARVCVIVNEAPCTFSDAGGS